MTPPRPSDDEERALRTSLSAALTLAATLAWSCPSSLHAQATRTATRPQATLVFEGDAGTETCASETTLRELVAGRLGYDPFVAEASRHVRVQVLTPRRGRLAVRIETTRPDGGRGEREFVGAMSECSVLVESAVFAVSIAIDPAALQPQPVLIEEPAPAIEPEPAPVVEPTPAPMAEPVPMVEPEPAPLPDTDDAVHVALSLGISGSIGASIGIASFGASFGPEVRYRDFRVALTLRGDVPNGTSTNGGRIEAHLLAGDLAACGIARPFFACGVVTVGVLRGQGHGFSTDREVLLPHAALGARTGLETRVMGPLSVRVQLDLLAHLTWQSLQVGDASAWNMAPVSAVLGLAAVLDLE